MCRFFSMQWVRALSAYTYAMRVDDDVLVHKLGRVLHTMDASNAAYGFALYTKERHGETVVTMNRWLLHYAKARGLGPRLLRVHQQPGVHSQGQLAAHVHGVSGAGVSGAGVNGAGVNAAGVNAAGVNGASAAGGAHCALNIENMFFSNFFMTRVDWWRRAEVQGFLRAVDMSGGIYRSRWGDAPIHTAALQLFAEHEEVVYLHVDYSHGSTGNEVRNGQEVEFRGVVSSALPDSYSFFLRFFAGCFAPCAVVDYFTEPTSPLVLDEAHATRTLKQRIHEAANVSRQLIDRYLPLEAAMVAQFDLYQSDAPLPPDSIVGLERRLLLGRLVVGSSRADDMSDEELVSAVKEHRCCKDKRPDQLIVAT